MHPGSSSSIQYNIFIPFPSRQSSGAIPDGARSKGASLKDIFGPQNSSKTPGRVAAAESLVHTHTYRPACSHVSPARPKPLLFVSPAVCPSALLSPAWRVWRKDLCPQTSAPGMPLSPPAAPLSHATATAARLRTSGTCLSLFHGPAQGKRNQQKGPELKPESRPQRTSREKGSFDNNRSVLFWYRRISRSATVPGRYLLFTPVSCCVTAPDLRRATVVPVDVRLTDFVACLGDLPLVERRMACFGGILRPGCVRGCARRGDPGVSASEIYCQSRG